MRERGIITSEFTVWCYCECWHQEQANNRSEMAKMAKSMGWKYTRKKGWICPGCQKGPNEYGHIDHHKCGNGQT